MSQVTRQTGPTDGEIATTKVPDGRPIGEVVVETVARVEGVRPDELAPLYDSLDPDALDSLYAPAIDPEQALCVTFAYAGYEVVIEDGDVVTVRQSTGDRA